MSTAADQEGTLMTRTVSRWRIAYAVCTIAGLATLLYTIGAPFNHGG